METLIIWPFDLETSHFVNTHTLSLLFINTYFLYCKVMRASTTSSKHCNLMEKTFSDMIYGSPYMEHHST